MAGVFYFCIMNADKKILLHVCCAPCASASVERLQEDGWEVSLFYSNSNIDTYKEYKKRLSYVEYLAKFFGVPLLIDPYAPDDWESSVKGMEKEPEKGKRCTACFQFSFQNTSQEAANLNIPYFCSTLTISPHKDSGQIKRVGERFDNYHHYDFKKKDGYKRSIELSRKMELYRQDYCACKYSRRI